MPDQAATSSPAPSRVPRARPRKHAITGHQYVLPQAAGHLAPAAAPARSPLHHCPSGLVQQHRCRVASTPRRESRRPSCSNRLPAAIKRPPRSPRHHAPPSLLPPSPLPRSATTRVAHLPPLFLRRGKSPSSISLSEPPLPKVSPGRASPSTLLSPYALGFENGGRNHPTTEAPVSFAASHGGRAREARAPISPCPSISLSVFSFLE
jgi:hypothetical protein